jgi:membrane protein DedA with SNARE-associated domain
MELVAIFDPTQVEHWLEAGGYLVLFALLFACGLGMPLPEDIPLTLAGFLIAQDKMHVVPAAIVAWCGIIGGDCVLYNLGRKYGLNISRLPLVGRHVTRQRIERAERLFEKYGIWVVAIGRMFAGIRGAMVVAAGTIRYSFIKFIIADGLAAIVSGGLFVLLGYWLGRTISDFSEIVRKVAPYKEAVMAGVALAVILAIAYLWWRHRRRKTISAVVADSAERAREKRAAATEQIPP